VRSGPATGIRARKLGLLPHAREKLCDPRFQAKITSPSRLPLSRSRTRRVVDPRVAARGRVGELEIQCQDVSRLDSRCFLHSMTPMSTPLDRTSPSTSRRSCPAGNAEAFPRPFRRVENETPASFEDEADPFPIPSRGSRRDSPLTWRVARVSFSHSAALRPGDAGSLPLPIVSSRALLEWVAPSGVKPTPRDESVGNARDRTDALGHSTIIPTRWSLVRGRRKSRRNRAAPIPRRVGESRPRGAFHCLCFSRA